jgi:Fe-S cluster assembly ATP-binding protein
MKPLLEVKNITITPKGSKEALLKDVSFAIGHNEIHCLLGKNGSGKSTLAYAVMGIDRYMPVKGRIEFAGKDITRKKTYERARIGISLAFQEPARFDGLTVRDFLRSGRRNASSAETAKALELVGLTSDILDRSIDEKLSGGERKRIEIASVIIMRPKLIIMDEPDASLDIIVYNEFYDLLLRIKDDLGCSILLITHREEAGLVADKASLIDRGRIVRSGSFREVMGQYCNRMGRKKICLRLKKLVN